MPAEPRAAQATGPLATSTNVAFVASLKVTTCGQRRHADRPSCRCQRQIGRIVHGGKLSVTAGKDFTIRSTS